MRVRRNSYEEDSFGGLVSRAAHANASFRQYGVLNRIGCFICAEREYSRVDAKRQCRDNTSACRLRCGSQRYRRVYDSCRGRGSELSVAAVKDRGRQRLGEHRLLRGLPHRHALRSRIRGAQRIQIPLYSYRQLRQQGIFR